jgi:pimeloyl-ACP methyl ester carboxylesterase
MLEHLLVPDALPPWVSEGDLAFYVGEFARDGFRGGLNWYRCADASWELTAAWSDARVQQPALFVAGERDGVIAMMPGAVDAMKAGVPGLRRALLLPGCGHWTQQERPRDVNAAMIEFLKGL